MRLMDWNIEWMNDWYVNGSSVQLRNDNPGKGITDVDDLATRVAGVIRAVDPDVVTIQEGPSDPREMELFVTQYLNDAANNATYEQFGGIDGGAQKVYILIRDGGALSDVTYATDNETVMLMDPWEADVDGDMNLEGYEFTRLPVVVAGELADGRRLTIASLHTKSKYVHNGEAMWNNPSTRPDFVRAALKNRRRISSEGMRMRLYLDALVEQDEDANIIVTGDFNDGPGVDYFESRYLTHNVTDIVLGSTYYPELLFSHAFLHSVSEDRRYTAVFDDFIDNIQNRRLVLDHIIVSPALALATTGDVAHEAYNAAIDNGATGRQKYPSDHRPVVAEIAE